MGSTKGKRVARYETHVEPRLKTIATWASKGATILEMAQKLGISPSTLREWRKQHKEFDDAIKAASKIASDQVVGAVFRRALGYDYEETTEKPLTDVIAKKLVEEYNAKLPEGKTKITVEDFEQMFKKETVVTQRIKKHVPGDVTAQIFWLTNREKEEWKHRSEQTIKNEGDIAEKLDKAQRRTVDAEFQRQAKGDGKVINFIDKQAKANE